MMSAIRTTCAYCGVGCGIAATRHRRARGRRSPAIPSIPPIAASSAPRARISARRSASKGGCSIPRSASSRASWDKATRPGRASASPTRSREHGPDSVAFYVSGQLLTEDYYVANKLMKGFIGIGEHRHQFAAVHVERGRRPYPRVRRGCRAGELRRSRRGRPDRAGRIEHRLVPSDRLSADHGRARARAAPSWW